MWKVEFLVLGLKFKTVTKMIESEWYHYTSKLLSLPDPPGKTETGSSVLRDISYNMGWAILHRSVVIAFKSGTGVSHASVHIGYYATTFTKAQDGHTARKKGCETRLHYLQFSSEYNHSCHVNKVFCDLIGDLSSEISPTPPAKKWCSEHQTLLAHAKGLGTWLPASVVRSCIIPDDGLGIKAKTLDCLMNWFISVVDDKSINGWNNE